MSVAKFRYELGQAKVAHNDRVWFPRWVQRLAKFQQLDDRQTIAVDTDSVVAFSTSVRKAGTPAWQRLQGVRAIESYRNLVLKTKEPDLAFIKKGLQQLAATEELQSKRGSSSAEVPTAEGVVGPIDPSEPSVIQEMRRELRLQRYAYATEDAYVGWIRRFAMFCGSSELTSFGATEIRQFLSELAVEGQVAKSTQQQATSALLFLYQRVFAMEIEFLDIRKADGPPRLPVVLTRQEIALLYPKMVGRHRLTFSLLYGAGLRHKECRRLRIKDVGFGEKQILVRNGKGDKDRITMLPDLAVEDLRRQIEQAQANPRSRSRRRVRRSLPSIRTRTKIPQCQ